MDLVKSIFHILAVEAPIDTGGGNTDSLEAGNVIGRIFPPFSGMSGSISLTRYILMLFNVSLYIGLIAALMYIVYGGVKWVTAGGDPKALDSARGTIMHAIIGVLLLSLGLVISQAVGQFVSPALDETNSKAIYICGYGNRKEQCDMEGIPPSECYKAITCHQVYSRVSNEKFSNIKMSYPDQYCTEPTQCDRGCKANENINEYKYCQPY